MEDNIIYEDWKRFLKTKEDSLVEWVVEFLDQYEWDEDEGQEKFDEFAEDLLQRFPEMVEE